MACGSAPAPVVYSPVRFTLTSAPHPSTAHLTLTGLLSAAIFLIYDGTKVVFGLPTTSGIRKSKEKK